MAKKKVGNFRVTSHRVINHVTESTSHYLSLASLVQGIIFFLLKIANVTSGILLTMESSYPAFVTLHPWAPSAELFFSGGS